MPLIAELLLATGSLLLLGLVTDFLGKRTFLPRVTLLLILGVMAGDGVLALIPASLSSGFEVITNLALLMIGFLLGGKLTPDALSKKGYRQVFAISLSAALGAVLVVALALFAIGLSPEISLLLGCIAAATDPAATVDAVMESKSDNIFSRLLTAIVAIDDAWALILFSLGLAFVSLMGGDGGGSGAVHLLNAAYEITGALLLGGLIGLPAAYLTGRLSPGQPMLTEALGLVLICGGLALWLEVSFLIAAMTMGATIANLAKHHDYAFHEIENIEWPFMVVFFILAGATLEIDMMAGLGLVGLVYILARAGGKILGAWLGGRLSRSDGDVQRWMGLALMPQAGVAIGMALLTASEFPDHRQTILSIAIGTTVFFELAGPLCSRFALRRARRDK